MDFGLTVEETKDKDLILSVLTHPEIYSCIIDDDSPDADSFTIDTESAIFLVGKVSGNAAGVMVFHVDDGWYIHIQVLPEYRKEYAKEFGDRCLKWFFELFKEDLNAEIPSKYKNVSRFAENMGFEYRETFINSCVIDGIVYNVDKYQLRYSKWALGDN